MTRKIQHTANVDLRFHSPHVCISVCKVTVCTANGCTVTACTVTVCTVTLTLLTWTIWRAPTSASKWRMGFNSVFKRLIYVIRKARPSTPRISQKPQILHMSAAVLNITNPEHVIRQLWLRIFKTPLPPSTV